jgi:hypothetical protein
LVESAGSGAVVAEGRPWLADQGRADHLAVAFDQASLRLFRKDRAGDLRHGERIGKARDQRQHDQNDDGGADFSEHFQSP